MLGENNATHSTSLKFMEQKIFKKKETVLLTSIMLVSRCSLSCKGIVPILFANLLKSTVKKSPSSFTQKESCKKGKVLYG